MITPRGVGRAEPFKTYLCDMFLHAQRKIAPYLCMKKGVGEIDSSGTWRSGPLNMGPSLHVTKCLVS